MCSDKSSDLVRATESLLFLAGMLFSDLFPAIVETFVMLLTGRNISGCIGCLPSWVILDPVR